jgi:hypothetical protein
VEQPESGSARLQSSRCRPTNSSAKFTIAELMRMRPISTRVNKPENDDPSILDPIEALAERYVATTTCLIDRRQVAKNPSGRLGVTRGYAEQFLFRTMPRPFASFPLKLYLKRRNEMRSGDGWKETSLPHPWPFQIPQRSAAISLPCCSRRPDFGRRLPRVPFAGTHWHAGEILR